MDENLDSSKETNDTTDKPGWLSIAFSVIAAAFGVQSSKNRERDFASGSYLPFIIGGVVFTALFVLVVMAVVSAVLGSAN